MSVSRSLRVSAALAALAAALWATACGGGGSSSGASRSASAAATARATPSQPRHPVADFDGDDYQVGGDADDDDSSPPYDRDGDSDNETGATYDADDTYEVHFGRAATAREASQVRSLIDRYFAAMGALDGRAACALMPAVIVKRIPEIYGKGTGPPYARGSTCPQIVASVFAFYRRQLSTEARAVEVVSVRVQGAKGLAVLAFKRDRGYPMRLIELARVPGGWRVNGMLDNELP